jgi:hypothetical protein
VPRHTPRRGRSGARSACSSAIRRSLRDNKCLLPAAQQIDATGARMRTPTRRARCRPAAAGVAAGLLQINWGAPPTVVGSRRPPSGGGGGRVAGPLCALVVLFCWL